MPSEPRPYVTFLRPALEKEASANWDYPETLERLLAELNHRTWKGAIKLRERIIVRLDELRNESFPWPNTWIHDSNEALKNSDRWSVEGLLKAMGYSVGTQGVPENVRRKILDRIYRGRLPDDMPKPYMAQWGIPESGPRLRKLANVLASLARNAKRRVAQDLRKAIREWEADLEYLRVTYYLGRYDFGWPSTG